MKTRPARAPLRILASGLVHFRPAGLPFTWRVGCRLVRRGVARTTAGAGGTYAGPYAVRAQRSPGAASLRAYHPTACGDTSDPGTPQDRESSLLAPLAHPAYFIHFLSHSFMARRRKTDRAASPDLLLHTHLGYPMPQADRWPEQNAST